MLAIYGSGGFGRELVAPASKALERLGRASSELIFVDDNPLVQGQIIAGVPVCSLSDLGRNDEFILALGDGKLRAAMETRCIEAGLRPFSLFADDFASGVEVEIGEGAVFCARAMVTASAQIGRQFQCNIYSYVAHDCVIGDYVTFAPGVCCNGNVHIGDYAYIGTNAVIRQGSPGKPLVIGEGATIGMGAVVTKDVAAGTVVVGNPARPR